MKASNTFFERERYFVEGKTETGNRVIGYQIRFTGNKQTARGLRHKEDNRV